jgi:hypothetical protein
VGTEAFVRQLQTGILRGRDKILRRAAFVEAMERRTMLSAAASPSDASDRLDSALLSLAQEYSNYQQSGKPAESFKPSGRALRVRNGAVQVELHTLGNGKTLLKELKKLHLTGGDADGRAAWGWLPINQISQLATIPALLSARASQPMLMTGSVTSQGDQALRANIARATYGYTGSGIKVGILSDSFDTGPGSYSTDVASGDLPSGVQVLEEYAGGTDEGRAMAQLVYDSAPGVTLAFATAFNGETDFANNIKALRDAGCKVIVDDVIYFDEPMFQDGAIAQAIDNVVASGVSYFSAAGNEARQAYDSVFRNDRTLNSGAIRSSGGPSFKGGTTFDFDPGAGLDDMQQFTLAGGQSIQLSFQWDQPYGSIPGSASCASEVDVYVLNSGGTRIVGGSTATNSGAGFDPVELVQFTNSGANSVTYNLMIVRRSGATPGEIKYVDFGSAAFTQFTTSSGALFGHANAAGAAAVGAAGWYNTPAFGVTPPIVQSYSSAGSTNILFTSAGVRLGSATVRQRPNFVAPDGGNTTFFYSDSTVDPDTTPNFFGTSAAAPAAGAVAALMLSANGSLTPAQIYTALQNSTIDMDDPSTGTFDAGFDWATGYGLIRADVALASVLLPGTISGVAFRDYDADGTRDAGEPGVSNVTLFLDTNNNGTLDGGETTTLSLGNGTYSFSVAPGTYNVRQQAPTGTLGTDIPPYAATVTSGASVNGPNFGDFPTVFTGTAQADTYTIALDPGDSTRVRITEALNGFPVVVYSIQQSRLSTLTFNAGSGDDTFNYNGPLTVAAFFNGNAGNNTFNVNGGAYAFNTDARILSSNLTLNVNAGSVALNATQHLANLNIATGASVTMAANGNRYLQTKGLTLTGTARLDLNDNDLLVEYPASSPFTQVRQWVFDGYSATSDSTRAGIVSTSGQNSNGTTILALVDGALAPVSEWPPGSGNTVAANTIIGKYTYFGDLDFNGMVNSQDYTAVDANLGSAPAPGIGWLYGDADGDGLVTPQDYTAIDASLGLGIGNPL